MVSHYIITVVKPNMKLKLTYKNKRFSAIKHLSGTFDEFVIRYLGAILPVYENEVTAKTKEYSGRVTYSLEVKEKTLYTQFNDAWHLFYMDFKKITPKFTGADGNALKSIIKYLQSISATDQEALAIWKGVLNQWHLLDAFHKKNTDLKYINSRLNVIIDEIKRITGVGSDGSNSSTNEAAESFTY